MNETQKRWIIVNGEFYPEGEKLIPAGARAVRYGDGCFETLRGYQGQFLKLEAHLERLEKGLKYLDILSPLKLEKSDVKSLFLDLLQKNGLDHQDAVVRLQVWRNGKRGFSVPSDAGAGYAISATPLPQIPSSVVLATVPTRRIPSEALDPNFKLSNSINYIRAASEASRLGADDALMLTTDQYVAETTIANIFWLRDGRVFTPSKSCDILPGITRDLLMEQIVAMNDPLETGKFELWELLKAETAWICNSLREIVPVQSLDDQTYNTGHPMLAELKDRFNTIKDKQLS